MKIKLFCFPYAGGSAPAIFNKWKSFIPHSIELRPVELAGRGARILQPPYRTVDDAVSDILSVLQPEIASGPYALLGHSMGAMLVHELALKIRTEGWNKPAHLFFSGRGAPSIKIEEEKKYHLLRDDKFKQRIFELGGTPPEFFEYPELQELFMPLLRNDFRLACTDVRHLEITPHDCNISVFIGKTEDIRPESADAWKSHTKGICTITYFNGGHFFINDQTRHIVNSVMTALYQNQPMAVS